ncbi:hypothetical protein HX089_16585 [Myroides odoratimimus]|uniref:hypothetical protein n=1 Tax=Myroides odoratimimus TaxID=76832 RepID=UPI0025791218|nr:hypothetical protein [Myroides odoratimimus]MDM1507503.1 hypothetical protein [Myroides odoratimimus]MDM1517981.1 hypothetical protein [Myroides odoratimimus]
MAKKEKSTLLPDDTIVEVVMRKSMTMSEYERIKNNSKSKGWNIQAYQEGVYSDGLGKSIE